MTFDLDSVRARIPALSIRDNSVSRIYFDNPAGTQVPQSVVDAMSGCLVQSNANLHGPFLTSERAVEIVAEARAAMADLLNASSPNEIIFGQNWLPTLKNVEKSCEKREDNATDTKQKGNQQPYKLPAIRLIEREEKRLGQMSQLAELLPKRPKRSGPHRTKRCHGAILA